MLGAGSLCQRLPPSSVGVGNATENGEGAAAPLTGFLKHCKLGTGHGAFLSLLTLMAVDSARRGMEEEEEEEA